MAADVRIKWHLELVGDVASPLLRQDRQIRTSLRQTEQAQKRLVKETQEGGRARQRASVTATAAMGKEGRAARSTATNVRELNRAQAQALSAGSRLAGSAQRIATAYRGQARAAREASAAERARAAATRAGGNITGAAQRSGAGLTRGTQAAIGAAAGGGIVAKTISTFAGFEQQMDRVAAVSGATRSQMQALNQQAKDLGANTSFSAREAADGMYQLSTAGFKTQEVMRAMPGTLDLAAASGVDLAAAAELQGSALRGFGLRASESGRVADVLAAAVNSSAIEMADLGETLPYVASTARQTGTSFEEVAAAAAILGNAGIKGSMAGTALRTSMLRLTDPTKKMVGQLADMGIGADELAAKPLPEVIGRVAEGLKKLPTRGERVGAVAAIFGKEAAPAMLNLLSQGRSGIDAVVKALDNSEGTAKRTAKTMRDNVAGGWDEFTGSLETAAITLTERFGPALHNALSGGARGVNALARGAGDFAAGLAGDKGGRERKVTTTDLHGRQHTRTERDEPNALQRAGLAVSGAASKIGRGALAAGAQLLDAFKPALPFFQNILLPLLEGVGKGILVSVVGAFKVLVPVIRGVSTVLGAIGKVAKPLAPVFRGIGTVIGAVFAGPILRGIGLLGKLGSVFRIVGLGAKLLAVPIRLAGVLIRGVGAIVGKAAGTIGAFASKVGRGLRGGFQSVRLFVAGVPGAIGGAATAVLKVGGRILSAISWPYRKAGSLILGLVRPLAERVGRGFARIGGAIRGALGGIGGFVSGVFSGVVGTIRGALNGVIGAVNTVIGAFNKLPGPNIGKLDRIGGGGADPGPIRGNTGNDNRPTPAGGARVGFRRGGRLRRYQDGGLIPARVSPGELAIMPDGSTELVPGPRIAADNVLTAYPPGTAIVTGDGQERLAAGASLADVLASQAPHFRAGGIVPGRYDSTAYGPPWSGGNGTGVTATGVNLKGGRRVYGVAVDPRLIPLGSSLYVQPNPHHYAGAFRAFDTGSAIKGRRLDFYDWRGRAKQNGWGHKDVRVSRAPINGGGTHHGAGGSGGSGEDATARVPIMLGRSRTRAGLLGDALTQGISAGEAGLTRGEIAAAARGARGARANPLVEAIRGAQSATRREVSVAGAGDPSSRSSGGGGGRPLTGRWIGGGWDGTENVVRRAIRGLGSATYKRAGVVNGNRNSDHGTWIKNAFAADVPALGARGDRIFQAVARRLGIAARKGSWNKFPNKPVRGVRSQLLWYAPDGSHRDHVHLGVRRMRRGGLLGAGAAGPRLSSAAASYGNFTGGSGAKLDEAIGRAADAKIEALRAALLGAVRRGGDKRNIQRLQGAIDLIDGEVGRRIGRIRDAITTRTSTLETTRAGFDRGGRRLGIDPATTAGIERTSILEDGIARPILQANVRSAQSVLRRAQRTGNAEVIRQAVTDLDATQGELDENLTAGIERRRDWIRAAAQEAGDVATFGVDTASNALAGLDIAQRRNRTADTAGGMRERAGAIASGLIPALQAQQAAIRQQGAAALATGDVAGYRSAVQAFQSNANDLATAVADAADLVRDAAVRASQDVVDQAAHGTTLASSGLQRLELEQRLAGTFESGGTQRSAFITGTIVPALTAELGALQEQERVYREQGMTAELRQTIEAESAKSNEILQAQLDAQEAANELLESRKFGGTLGFDYGGDTVTDALLAVGNGG